MSKKKDKKKEQCPVWSGFLCKVDTRGFYKTVRVNVRKAAPTCYISGAIAHHDLAERMAAFGRAAAALEKAGYEPVNPFNNGLSQSQHWTEHMRRDIGLLVRCDYIYMLKGWELSKGAKLELDVASSCGIKVLFEH